MSVKIGKIINGKYVFDGLITSAEITSFSEMIGALKENIPSIEQTLKKKYGNTLMYKYYLGSALNDFIERFHISEKERRQFWDAIKENATTDNRKRKDGVKSKTRSFYEQCSVLAKIEIDTVKKLSWRQWQSLLDRIDVREEERIYKWLGNLKYKIREDDWRSFQKALHSYLKNKDISVLSDEKLFHLFDSCMIISQQWRENLMLFSKQHPNSGKLKNKGVWEKKYINKCFEIKKQKRINIDEDLCKEAFSIMYSGRQ